MSTKVKASSLRLRKIKNLLGTAYSTANNKLIKKIIYYYIKKQGITCYKCGNAMSENDWSIEHKHPWLYSDDPVKNFFDLDNIGYSHSSCNFDNSRKAVTKGCPSISSYNKGCRCEGCVSLMARNSARWKKNKKLVANPSESGGRILKRSEKSDERRQGKQQLGENVSTAMNRLIRNILIDFTTRDGVKCFDCGKEITRNNYTIGHKKDWMKQPFPKKYFFDLSNFCLRHKNCKKT